MRVQILALFLAGGLALASPNRGVGQQSRSQPGQFDFYLLNLSWSPEFCASGASRHRNNGASAECTTPHGFILHGLWPSNADGTEIGDCSNAPGPRNPEKYIDLTPDPSLIQHEWRKHGTCSGLPADTFFNTAREAVNDVHIPDTFKSLAHPLALTPDAILNSFYQANPGFPQGSFALSCGNNRLTAIEACFNKDTLKPIACQNVKTCHANSVRITPEITDAIVQ